MRVLLLNQCFHPDVMATGQYLTQLAVSLSERGHEVTVITSDRGYDDPGVRFPTSESWNGISILRISSLALGKQSKWRRAINFASFLTLCSWRLLLLPHFDVVVGLTSPPLISFLGALFVKLKGGRFCFWVMDLNPDEAIAAGWLRPDSATATALQKMLTYSLRHAEKIIVLDRFMKERILQKGIDNRHIFVIPPWSHDNTAFDPQGRESFRNRHGIADKFVVMYSGNHSPCHPLDTLLHAALVMKDRADVAFYFVGGGSEQKKVRDFAEKHSLGNVACLPYQPLDQLSASLSAADLHVVAMGEQFVGIVHPSKVYNIMAVGAPTLYIGPSTSHVTDIASQFPDKFYLSTHGDVEAVLSAINIATNTACVDGSAMKSRFAKQDLLTQMVSLLESNEFNNAPVPKAVSAKVGAFGEH